jgi:predicted dehydrogenase
MEPVKHAVIGLGWFGEKHCETVADADNMELYAVCTRTKKTLDRVARRFKIKHKYTDYHKLLANPEIDSVSITTMWDQHAVPTVAALASGKHVFLEKPMASTVPDCKKIVAAAKKAKGRFMVGHICRFNPRYAAAKREIESGAIGDVVSMYARRNLAGSITDEILNKIGPIIGDGVHDTDLMLWFSGAKIVSAYAQTTSVRNRKHPDIGWTMYRFDNGATGVLEDVWNLPGKTPFQIDERMTVVGTQGHIQIHDTCPNFSVTDQNETRFMDTTYWPELHGLRSGALREELMYFARCILTGKKPDIITPEESMAAVAACLAAEKSAATGKIVKFR